MPQRKVPLVKDEIYHIYNRSIAEFRIFNSEKDYGRIIKEFVFYGVENPPCKFTYYNKESCPIYDEKIVDILAYCIMPTHFHIILKELKDYGITKFMNAVLKSYSRYFNFTHKRKGPLWENRFSNVLLTSDDQLMHDTRYIHLNPVTALLVDDPKDWVYSSYREYIGMAREDEAICNFSSYININSTEYAKFVVDQIQYQRELAVNKAGYFPGK